MTPTSMALTLARASLEGAALALTVGAITRLAPRLPAAARCALWWLASLKLLLGLTGLPALSFSLPSLAAAPAIVQRAGQVASLATPITNALSPAATVTSPSTSVATTAASPGQLVALVLLALWLAGVVATVLFHLRDARRLARLWRHASPVESPEVRGWLAGWIGADRARRVELRASAEVGAPLIMGGQGARIVVPSTCLDRDTASLRMALAHEISHVRRGDLGWGLVPALAQCAFWFHPLAHWCTREYAQTREEACDAEALRLSDATPHRYGALLVEFGVDRSRPVVAAASCGSAHVLQLTRRLHMLRHASRSSRRQRLAAGGAVIAIALLAIVPVRFVASAAAIDSDDHSKSQTHTSTHTATSTTTHTKTKTQNKSSRGSQGTKSSSGYAYSTDGDEPRDSFSYGFSRGDDMTMSGYWDGDDQEWLDKLKHRAQGDYAWFRIDGKTYLLEGKEEIARLKEIMRPEAELGDQQSKLGDQQSKLGDQQSALGDRQSALGDQQSDLASQIENLQEEANDARHDDTDRPDLERRMDDLRDRMQLLSEKQSALGEQQSKLGVQQSALGQKQSELGRRQSEASRQSRNKMRELAPQLVRSGRAVLVDG